MHWCLQYLPLLIACSKSQTLLRKMFARTFNLGPLHHRFAFYPRYTFRVLNISIISTLNSRSSIQHKFTSSGLLVYDLPFCPPTILVAIRWTLEASHVLSKEWCPCLYTAFEMWPPVPCRITQTVAWRSPCFSGSSLSLFSSLIIYVHDQPQVRELRSPFNESILRFTKKQIVHQVLRCSFICNGSKWDSRVHSSHLLRGPSL